MNAQTAENQVLKGRSLAVARSSWVVFALTLTLLQIASQVAMLQQLPHSDLAPSQLLALQTLGLTPPTFNLLRFVWNVPNALVWGGLGLLIFLRKSNERSPLIISALMVGIGMAASIPPWQGFAAAYPDWVWIVPVAAFIGNLCIGSFFFVFPTGRFVPRWAMTIAVGYSVYNILNSYGFALPPSLIALGQSVEWLFPIFALVSLIAVIGAPIYRYRKVSTALERQQIKLVVLTIAFAFTLFAVTASTTFWAPGGNPGQDISFITVYLQPAGWMGSLLLIPLSIAVSILRYRLFDIDVIIRKTLVYSVLTGLLALIYFGGVVLVQQFTRSITGEASDVAIVVSTLVIAALFFPLRRRVQSAIDRRFYRRKYDAAKTLAAFGVTARDEVELEKLTAELLNVVNETMQPASVSLWLKPTADSGRRTTRG